jgi:hypothetical protein
MKQANFVPQGINYEAKMFYSRVPVACTINIANITNYAAGAINDDCSVIPML